MLIANFFSECNFSDFFEFYDNYPYIFKISTNVVLLAFWQTELDGGTKNLESASWQIWQKTS